MGTGDFGFSLSDNSVNKINGLIDQYAGDIVALIYGLQEELIAHISSANYNKLLRAVEGIIELYNDVVHTELKQTVFEKWQDTCKTMVSFLESMEMGEESERVAASIEERLSDVFDIQIENRLSEVVIDGKTGASSYDFDQIKDIFSGAVIKARELSDDFSGQIEKLSEENEFYAFLLPVIVAYNAGIIAYFDQSRKKIDDLEDSYLEKMESEKDTAHESKKETDLSSLLHGLSDLAYDGMETIGFTSIKIPVNQGESPQKSMNNALTFEGENFSDKNIKLFVVIMERIVDQVGVEELNDSVETHYHTLSDRRKAYAQKAGKEDTPTHNHNIDIVSNPYGRYTVTGKSIQEINPVWNQVGSILDGADRFYKEKFESLGEKFEKANAIIHTMSSFCELWGSETLNLSEIFPESNIDSSFLEKIQLGALDLALCANNAKKIINGGAFMLNIIEWAMPYLKKSKMLVRLSEKVWNLTRQDIQIPYAQKMMDQYMMEHYERKYGMVRGKSPYFGYYHNVVASLDDNQRRAFENSLFAAEIFMIQNYRIDEMDPNKNRALCCGLFLNLVRSGMCSKQDIQSETANKIVDKLYDTYISKENINPRVDVNPDNRVVR